MRKSIMTLAASAAFALTGPHLHAGADTPQKLACSFKSGSTVAYARGQYKSAGVMPLSFKISKINLKRQRASLEAGSGTGALRIVRAVNANHFLEVVTEGFLNVTTVYDFDAATASYPAVHSRHFGLFGEPVISQYFGFCKAVQ